MEIKSKIYTIRGKQVMLDKDIAELYEVKTIRLREQVKRNMERFPEDFCFQLTDSLNIWYRKMRYPKVLEKVYENYLLPSLNKGLQCYQVFKKAKRQPM